MPAIQLENITVHKLEIPLLKEKSVEWSVLRLDKIHPVISGNKWFKLKYYLEEYREGSYKGIITFGGAWSNHIVATACLCAMENIPSIGIIRGERPSHLSNSLRDAQQYGMELEFVSRTAYSNKKDTTRPGFLVIPEGGAGEPGEKGASEILHNINKDPFTHFIMPYGTGTMLNGISRSVHNDQKLIGIAVLKGMEPIEGNISINTNYHFGGYAKSSIELIAFMNQFYRDTGIPTDFVYTGKLMFAINDLIQHDHFSKGSRILSIHSGGLQGNCSLPKETLIFG